MIKPLLSTFAALLLLTSCAPATNPAYLYTSQRYAERVSDGVFRLPDTFDKRGQSRLKLQRNTVVPVQIGGTVVVEKPSTVRGRLLVGLPRGKEKAAVLVYDETDDYSLGELAAPEGWTATVASEEQTVTFSGLVNADTYYWVDMGGEHEIEGKGIHSLSTAVRLSVPINAQPGRYFVEATLQAANKKRSPPQVAFIVEVF